MEKDFANLSPHQIVPALVVRGEYLYLYLFLDLFSRKIVGWEVHAHESMNLSSKLLQKICLSEEIDKG